MSATAIHTEGIRQSFGDVTALDGLDLSVEAGTRAWLAGLLLVFVPLALRAFRRP
jgi:ABC-type sugar transport system ATPase subunit